MSPSSMRPAATHAASTRSSSPWQSRNQVQLQQQQSTEEDQDQGQNQRLSSITSTSATSPTSNPPPHPKPRTEGEKLPKRPLRKPRHALADPRTACSVKAHVPMGVLADGLSYAAEDEDGDQDQDQDHDEFDDEAGAATTATTTAFPRKDWSRAMPKDFDNSAAPSLFLDAAYAARRIEALKAMRGKGVAGR
ncbi:hypothetical protein BC567DRAFT_93026 [Phyllosticta citribraziliensis]